MTEKERLNKIIEKFKRLEEISMKKTSTEKRTKQYIHIGAEIGISGQRISQLLHKGLRCLRRSEPLRQLYRENQQHKTLNAMQKYQTRPDMHLYITELEEKYIKLLHKTTACPPTLKNNDF